MTNEELAGAAACRVAAQMFDFDGRKATILKAIDDALTESRRARVGDSEIIGREMCRAEKAEADVERLKEQRADAVRRAESVLAERNAALAEVERLNAELAALAAWQCATCGARFAEAMSPVMLDGVTRCSACARAEAAEARLTSPPAPSGWQQRIAEQIVAAIEALPQDYSASRQERAVPLVVQILNGQHAKDARPPVAEASPEPSVFIWDDEEWASLLKSLESGLTALQAFMGEGRHLHTCNMSEDGPCDCGYVEPEGVVEALLEDVVHVRRRLMEADASPAKDPIADAVHADLAPLASELIDIGHKLAKEAK